MYTSILATKCLTIKGSFSIPTFVYIFILSRGCILSYVRPSYERAVSNLDRSMHISMGLGRSLLVHRRVAHD